MIGRYIKILIFASAVAVLWLISVQIFWIDNAIQLRKDTFHQNVKSALTDLVDRLEKNETLSRLKSHHQGKYLFFDDDSTADINISFPDSGYDYVFEQDFVRDGNDIQIKIKEEFEENKIETTIKRQMNTVDSLAQILDIESFEGIKKIKQQLINIHDISQLF